MILSLTNIAEYLLNTKGIDGEFLLDSHDIVTLPFEVYEIERLSNASKNYGFYINRTQYNNVRKRYFVKQLRTFNEQDIEGFYTEYYSLYIFDKNPLFKNLKNRVAPIIAYDKYHHILVTKLLNYSDYNPYNPYYNEKLLVKVANLLNELHTVEITNQYEILSSFKQLKPFLLDIDINQIKYTLKLYGKSKSLPSYYAILNDTHLVKRLDEVSKKWVKRSLIHGDIKIYNFLELDDTLYLVDWEYADFGDPFWDIAAVLKELISKDNEVIPLNFDTIISTKKEKKLSTLFLEAYFRENISEPDKVKIVEYTAIHLLRAFYNGITKNYSGSAFYYQKATSYLNNIELGIKELF